jgi:hypothetical protein
MGFTLATSRAADEFFIPINLAVGGGATKINPVAGCRVPDCTVICVTPDFKACQVNFAED